MILRFIVIQTILLALPFTLFCQEHNVHSPDSVLIISDTNSYIIVHNISFSGNKRTKSYIVEREIALKPGIGYSKESLASRLRLTREQLMNTALFVDVLVDTLSLWNNEIDVIITLKERWYLWPSPFFRVVDRNWNVWINDHNASLSRVDIGLKVAHDNATGNNDRFNLWLIGGYTQRFSFNYFKPYFDKKLRFGYNVGLSYARNREVNYATDSNKQAFLKLPDFLKKSIRADVGFSYRKGSDLRMQVNTSYNYESADSVVVKLNPNYLGGGKTSAGYVELTYHMQYYKVDYIPYPLRGWYVDAYMLNRLGNNKNMNVVQLGGKFFGTWEIMKKTYVAIQAAGVLRLPASQAYFNSRLLGYGDVYMQGLEYYVADGTAGGMARATIRKQVFQFTFHNFFFKSKSHNLIPFRFFVKVFGNLGYVYNKNPGNSIMNNKLLRSGGFGLDIVTIYDWAIKLDFSYNQFDNGGKLYLHTQSDF